MEHDSRIMLLDDHLVSKIAAGEVIERPASVVKELVENAIDAGSTQITVELEDGGKKLIRVKDNGSGMTAKDAELALMRHTTSKIKTDDDLASINTLGFRGEALASIVSVSRLTLSTKSIESEFGTEISQEGKSPQQKKDIAIPEGTSVTVRDLFFNTPARQKYQKSSQTELSNIIDVITAYTLIYPEIHFTVLSDGKAIFTSPKTTDLLSNIATIYGKEVAVDMLPLGYTKDSVRITGYISKPSLTRAGRKSQSIYVNRRHIKNQLITRALYDAYHTLLPRDRHPVFVLSLDLDPSSIDVNVHPAKTEIRIEKENAIYEAVYESVRAALEKESLIPKVTAPEQRTIPFSFGHQPARKNHRLHEHPSSFAPRIAPRQTAIKEKDEDIKLSKLPQMTIVCQLSNTYIIAESADSMYLIDQHAAAERINYEKLKAAGDAHASQSLIAPRVITLSPRDASVLREHAGLLKSTGFDLEPYSDNSFSVRSLPVILGRQYDGSKVTDLIDNILETAKTTGLEDLKESIIKMLACKASIKAGDSQTQKEMLDLVKELESCGSPYTCPHGRPTIIEMSMKEIEKRFGRT